MDGAPETVFAAASSSSGATFEPILVKEGIEAWSEDEGKDQLSSIPSYLLGASLLRAPRSAYAPGSVVTLRTFTCHCRVYVVLEASSGGGAGVGRDGGLVKSLAADPSWLLESGSVPSCGAIDSSMAVFSRLVPQNSKISLPAVTEPEARVLLLAVPVAVGVFGVTMTSTSSKSGDATYEAMVLMSEGVVAWNNRDHKLLGVPPYLNNGILFQGPYRDVPAGTILTVRPNSLSRVYVLVERSNAGGLLQSLPAAKWREEVEAPRWHETPTMAAFGRSCPAGGALSLPPTQGSTAVLCVVVVPVTTVPVAPLEVSCCCTEGHPTTGPANVSFEPLRDGCELGGEGRQLQKVPGWMQGAAYLSSHSIFEGLGPPVGTSFVVRAAAASVVYAILEENASHGGLLPDSLPCSGWEKRSEGPEVSTGATTVVYARRVPARRSLELPPLTSAGAILGLAAKVDLEAFAACVETSNGTEFQQAEMAETVIAWSDRQFRYAWVPTPMTGALLFRGPHLWEADGTTIRISASGAARVYVIVEVDYKGSEARDGGLPRSLPEAGWRTEAQAPSWGDTNSTMKVFSIKLPENVELELPSLHGKAVFSVVVSNIAGNPDRVADELKGTFSAWDSQSLGGMRVEDLDSLLTALCPGLDSKARDLVLREADPNKLGLIDVKDFLQKVLASG